MQSMYGGGRFVNGAFLTSPAIFDEGPTVPAESGVRLLVGKPGRHSRPYGSTSILFVINVDSVLPMFGRGKSLISPLRLVRDIRR